MEAVGKDGETIANKRKRLIFRSAHRGIKEMDIIMGSFAEQFVPNLSECELADYDELLTHNDPDLYNWITGKEPAPYDVADMGVFRKLIAFEVIVV